jgi:hypothetical protein
MRHTSNHRLVETTKWRAARRSDMFGTMKAPWTKSKWGRADLNEQTVEFELTGEKVRVSGIGKFLVSENLEKFVAVNIEILEPGIHWSQIKQTWFHLGQAAVDRIQLHPDQTKGKCRLNF